MDPASTIPIQYIIIITLLLLGGAYFAAAETSFASVNRIRIISDKEDGSKRAEKALYVLDNFDDALTALLIGNNIMHIATSSVATLFASKMWGNSAIALTTFVITFIVFIFAEMLPKSYAKACCEKIAPILASSVIFFMHIFKPVSFVFNGLTNLLNKLMKNTEEDDPTVTEEELFDIIQNIDEEDKVDPDVAELVQSALEFTVTTAKDILIPWNKVVTINENMSADEIYDLIMKNHLSRIPVLDKEKHIIGLLQIKKYLIQKIEGKKFIHLRSYLDKPFYISDSLPIDEILPTLSKNRKHFAFVKDNDKNILGILTMEDLLEELVGEIYDEEEGGANK